MTDRNDTSEIVTEFLVESHEGLDGLDCDLLTLEQQGADAALLARIFRCVHTIKGTCGFLGFGKLESVTHVGEGLLSRLRDGEITVSPQLTAALLALVDATREMLAGIEREGHEGSGNYDALVATLTRLAEGDNTGAPPVGAILVEHGAVEPADIASAMHEQRKGHPGRVGEILVARGATTTVAVREALESQHDAAESRAGGVTDASIRVDVALLDKLMNLVGELVLARNQILQSSATQGDATLAGTTQRLNLITSELQEGVMKTRMQPIGTVWSKFPRVVRDLAVACSKQVVIDMEGADTELDKTIIEAIKDPLTHIVRNAVDHGIESPVERVKRGKPPEGRLAMRAFHEGGKVNIEIRDDGAGIDPNRLKSKAVERSLLTADAAARLGERDALALIFAPGFSTAARVTNVSGRGVGMDVVKTNIERIGGTVDVASTLGEGTTLRIKIPLTLAIIPGLVVTTGGNRFAIPQVSLVELVRLEGEEAKRRIEHIYDAPVYRLRDRLLPLVHLNHALGFTPEPWDMSAIGIINIVVLQADGTHFGLVVDTINDTEEIVVKPLGKQLKGIPAFAGATIMGDGRVAIILDVIGLATQQRLLGNAAERAAADVRVESRRGGGDERQLLLFGLGADRQLAFPLVEIARLEEIDPRAVERLDGGEVVQYRGEILPLVRLSRVLDSTESVTDGETLRVIVHEGDHGHIGLVVDRILDVVETAVTVQPRARDGAIAGSAIIQGRATDVIDVERLMTLVDRALGRDEPARTGGTLAHAA